MDKFTETEWQRVVEGPMVASFAITAADPSSFIGVLQESMETAKAMAEVHKAHNDNSLVGAVVSAYKDGEVRSNTRQSIREMANGNDAKAATDAAITRLDEIAQLVRRNSPDEAAAYLAWLEALAKRVAEAGTEGGFLGFGGEKVSEAEKRTLVDVNAVLRNASA